jgi:amidase
MDRRKFVSVGAVAGTLALRGKPLIAESIRVVDRAEKAREHEQFSIAPFELDEATVADLQSRMASGRMSSHAITQAYLERIAALDRKGPSLRHVIEVNPDALAIADSLDRERKAGRTRGPLHGIPIVIKDNLDTADRMMTTAGSLALEGSIAPQDSTVAAKLRVAGAVILGKTNLSEWANFRSSHSTSGWSGRGGQARNPYVLDRNPCGSSSGTGGGVSANLAALGIGTETDGSIVCPSSANGLVGIKPTLGLVSRAGIIPIAHSQDTAGPMARTVRDASILLGAIAGADPRDSATAGNTGKVEADYTKFLDANGLRGARIGVVRKYLGFNEAVDALMSDAIEAMKRQGAVIVDPVELAADPDDEFTVLLYEFKADLNAYLAGLGAKAPAKTLADIIAFNDRNKDREMPFFGQDTMIKAEAKGPLTEKAYIDALAKNLKRSRDEGIDATMSKNNLDALVAPTGGPAWLTDLVTGDHFTGGYSTMSAVAGYPHITLPMGFDRELPVGLSFFGKAYAEPTLIRLAYAYEQATKHRRAPRFIPSLAL